ncbi:YggL family protein [Vibrio parahaemolyticus]|nr:YggL family protein [Vibrio parahaemolyticus]
MATKRSRRLRKKLYVDEFKVLGFSFFCHLNITKEEECDLLINDFLSFLEGRGLVMGGGADLSSFDGFVVLSVGMIQHQKMIVSPLNNG